MPSKLPTILFFEEPSLKPLGPKNSLEIAGCGWDCVFEDKLPAAIALIRSQIFEVLVTNSPSLALLNAAKEAHPNIITILVTDAPMHEYTKSLDLRDVEIVDHIIANLSLEWTLSEIAVTLQKIIRKDFFGIEKYIASGSIIHSIEVKGSSNREACNNAVSSWIESFGLNRTVSRLASGISEELVMNAIFDAPTAGGSANYATLQRSQARELVSQDCPILRYGADQRLVAISITDPFGAFKRDTWFTYARKILKRNDDTLIDSKSGGAGLGIFKILFGSHAIICNVQPTKITEVIALISITQPIRDFDHMPRSIHYFNTDSHSLTSI